MDSHVLRLNFRVLEINECSPNPCKNDGSCTDLVNGFSCSCVAGYNGDDCSSGKYHSEHNILHTYLYCVLMQLRVVVRW